MNEHEIEVTIKGVTIAGQFIARPRGTPISEWMNFWDGVKALASTGSFRQYDTGHKVQRSHAL